MLLWLLIWRATSDSNRTRKHEHKSQQASSRALGVLANWSFDPIYILRLRFIWQCYSASTNRLVHVQKKFSFNLVIYEKDHFALVDWLPTHPLASHDKVPFLAKIFLS